ncbi:MAG: hypothetical protein QW795_06410 [Candidatus Bathyarchaeia archaeon]
MTVLKRAYPEFERKRLSRRKYGETVELLAELVNMEQMRRVDMK